MDKHSLHKHSNNSVAIVLAGGMIAAAIVFAALNIGNELKPARHESHVSADAVDESETEATDETVLREDAIRQQLSDQLTAVGAELVELSNYRITHNEKMIALDLSYKTKDNAAQQVCKDVELKEDDLGRYCGKLTIGNKAVAVVIY